MNRMLRALGLSTAGVLVAATLGACSSAAPPSPASSSPAAGITVTGAWARASSAMAAAGAAYMTITNAGSTADTLVGASSPAATTVEVHETVTIAAAPASGMDGMASPAASDSMGSMLGMQPIAKLAIPANGSVVFAPGGYHIMLIGLTKDLKVGDTIQVTLTFEKAGSITVTADVRAN